MVAALWLRTENRGYTGQTRSPIAWDDNGRRLTDVRDGQGHRVRDRIPALGYDGSDIHNMRPLRGVKRFVDYLRHDGFIAHVPLTNAAAHVPSEDESYQRDRRLKASYFGWIEWPSTGVSQCPCLMLLSGAINAEKIRSPACRGPAQTADERESERADAAAWVGETPVSSQWWGRPCSLAHVGAGKSPCIHAIAEKKARRAVRLADTNARADAARTDAARSAEMQALAQERQTSVLVEIAERQASMFERIAAGRVESKPQESKPQESKPQESKPK